MVMALMLRDSQDSIPRPESVAERLGFEVPEYERLFQRDREDAANLIDVGRRIER